MTVATLAVLIVDALIFSGTLLCPTRVPDTEIVNVRVGEGASDPAGSVEKVNVPIPEAPGASVAREGSLSLLKTTVWSEER